MKNKLPDWVFSAFVDALTTLFLIGLTGMLVLSFLWALFRWMLGGTK